MTWGEKGAKFPVAKTGALCADYVWHCEASMSTVATRYVILVLSIGIVVLMLGFPATLLNPTAQTDSFSASLLEGFTLPPFVHAHREQPKFKKFPAISFSLELPILATSLFRPPIT